MKINWGFPHIFFFRFTCGIPQVGFGKFYDGFSAGGSACFCKNMRQVIFDRPDRNT